MNAPTVWDRISAMSPKRQVVFWALYAVVMLAFVGVVRGLVWIVTFSKFT